MDASRFGKRYYSVLVKREIGCSLISGLVADRSLRALMEFAKNGLISFSRFEAHVYHSGLRSCGPTCFAITRFIYLRNLQLPFLSVIDLVYAGFTLT